MSSPNRRGQSSRIDFHRGQVLWTLANTYPSLPLTLVEGVQNGIDADATAILVGINLMNRTVIIADNGIGVSKDKFEQALASVGHGIKTKDKLGRFGRGLIAPLNKCTSFTFTSLAIGSHPIRWTFKGESIRKQDHEVEIPHVNLQQMPAIPSPFNEFLNDEFDTTYRTVVLLNSITKDKVISLVDLDELDGLIRSKLGPVMRSKGVKVRVVLRDEQGITSHCDINPVIFSGEKLPVFTVDDPDAGEVTIELYRAPRVSGKRKGEVVIMEAEGNYPVTMPEVIRQARGRQWIDGLEAAFNSLSSGFFEGVIRAKNIELAPERTKFVFNDALLALYMVIFGWFEEHGQTFFENEQEQSRERRFQDLGLKSLDKIREHRDQPEYARLWEAFKNAIETGRLGKGAVEPTGGEPDGLEDESSTRTGQGGAGKERKPRKAKAGKGDSDDTQPRDSKDRPGDTPFGTVGNPRSGDRRPRQLVKGDSRGLWFEFTPLTDSVRLWEFDFELGVLTFNTRHKHWLALSETNGKPLAKNDKMIMHLQEWLALQVVHLVVRHPDHESFEDHRGYIDDQIKHYIDLFIVR